MEVTDREAALNGALAQIDAHFGKGSEAARGPTYKVWMDRFTEDHLYYYLKARIEDYLEDEDCHPHPSFWESIEDAIEAGEHRILESHPCDRIYPPVTIGERIGFAVRRFMALFQKDAP